MNYLKYFESIENIREVNIRNLWVDYIKYKDKLKIKKSNNTPSLVENDAYIFLNNVIIPIIKDKYIEFNRIKNRYTDEITNNFSGLVKNVFIEINNNELKIIVEINNIKYYLIRNMELHNSFLFPQDKLYKIEDTILIHNSEKSEIENTINILNYSEKYNI